MNWMPLMGEYDNNISIKILKCNNIIICLENKKKSWSIWKCRSKAVPGLGQQEVIGSFWRTLLSEWLSHQEIFVCFISLVSFSTELNFSEEKVRLAQPELCVYPLVGEAVGEFPGCQY